MDIQLNASHAEKYLEAARLVLEEDFIPGEHRACCTALDDVTETDVSLYEFLQESFRDFFDEGSGDGSYWFGFPTEEENREPRVLALCFMAAIAADEEPAAIP